MAYLHPLDQQCDRCGKRRATLELRTFRNEKVGVCCKQCSTAWLKRRQQVEDEGRG